jgi:hypothetical protein
MKALSFFSICLLLASFLSTTEAKNPLLPATAFIPDGEPHVFEYKGEKRVFLYGSRDERIHDYCGHGHDVWSAPVNDLTNWTNHGEIFNVKQVMDIGYGVVPEQHFGAPDCVYNPVTRKYYLYTFMGMPYAMDGKEGPLPGSENYIPGFEAIGPNCVVAESDSPAGPFVNPKICDWPGANDAYSFDPTALVLQQDDGSVRVYAYWGMRKGDDRFAELDPFDMHTIIDGKTRKPDRNAWRKTLRGVDENTSTLFEASSIKQVAKDKFVFVYSANEQISALTYCYSNSPEGPWTYGGRIVHNNLNWPGGNDHGSIAEINGKWYVFYHRRTSNDFNRQAMVEPIDLRIEDDKVIIPTVEMTSQGVETNGLDAFRRYSANDASYATKRACIEGKLRLPDGLNPFVGIEQPNTVIGYKYLDFGSTKVLDKDQLLLRMNIQPVNPATVTLKVCTPENVGTPEKWVTLTEFNLQDYAAADGRYHEICVPVGKLQTNARLNAIGGLKGKLAVFYEFNPAQAPKEGNDRIEMCRLKEVELVKGHRPTPNPLRPVHLKTDSIKHGMVSALPGMSRGNESIKLTVVPEKGYELTSIRVTDEAGNEIPLHQNGAAPYALTNFNFRMPESPVYVTAFFTPKDLSVVKYKVEVEGHRRK